MSMSHATEIDYKALRSSLSSLRDKLDELGRHL